ncbi:hypothetical protein [Nocardia sp. NPDC004860]|uniref:hypothetical protein n=1 Tax=Nocardia sp. NPDC004860 TaxID=3154557 RepID=UPI0033B35969
MVREEAGAEVGEDFVSGLEGVVALFVDEVGGDDAVGGLDDVLEEGCGVGVGVGAGENSAVEAVAEELGVGGETLAGAPFVVVEAVGEGAEVVTFEVQWCAW